MASDRHHPRDELQLLLDDRLGEADRVELERHLGGCDRCRAELEALRWLKRRLAPLPHAPPEGLEARIRAALEAEDASAGQARHGGRRWLAVAAASILVVAAGVVLQSRRGGGLPTVAASQVRTLEQGTLDLQRATGDPSGLETWFASAGIDFHVRVFDFGMMNIRLLGGSVVRFAGGPSALFVYRAADGALVACQMYRGSLADLPAGGERRVREDGLEVRLFTRGGVTLAFWQEGEVVCFLAAPGLSADRVAALAFAKAVLV